MSLRRVVPLVLALALSACGGEAPQTVFAPLGYDYLRPLRLDVATLDVENRSVTHGDDVAALSPVPPAQALTQMAHDRIFPGGSAGRAVFVIQDASIRRHGDTLAGSLAVRLDIVAANGQPTAFAEARVARSSTTDEGDLRTRLYALTKQMMDDMNVEFEFQSRRALKASLQPDGDVPAAVSVQPLSGPGGTPGGGTGASGAVPPVAPGYDAPPGAGRAMSPPPGNLSLPSGYAPAAGEQDPRMDAPAGAPMPAASPYPSGVPQQAPSPYGYPQPAYGQPPYGQPAYGQDPYAPPGVRSPGMAAPYAPPPGLQSGPLPLTE